MKQILFTIFLSAACYTATAQTYSLQDTAFVKGAVLRKNIFFGYDSFSIQPESLVFLDSLAAFLNTNNQLQIEVGNHSDERGSTAYSKDLTGKRAATIAAYLISKGIDKNRLIAKGYGSGKPVIVHAKTEAEHAQNRRTDFTILHTDYSF